MHHEILTPVAPLQASLKTMFAVDRSASEDLSTRDTSLALISLTEKGFPLILDCEMTVHFTLGSCL